VLLLWTFICLGLTGLNTYVRIEYGPLYKPEPEVYLTQRDSIVELAKAQIGVRQINGNTGPEIDVYLACSGLDPGFAWCAAMMCWLHDSVNVEVPLASAWSPSWFRSDKVINKEEAQAGAVIGIYFSNLGRIAHVGMIIEDWDKRRNSVVTSEGNTNDTGAREGDGVYKKIRSKNQIYRVADWLN